MLYSHASFLDAKDDQVVSNAKVQHNLYAYGPVLQYGPNGNLGVGSSVYYNPYQTDTGMLIPNRFIAAETTVTLGGVSIKLIPSRVADAGLLVWLPGQKVLMVGGSFGKYFPPVGSLVGNNITAGQAGLSHL